MYFVILKRYQSYPETEIACKYPRPIFKLQSSKILVKCEQFFEMKTGKIFIGAAHPYQNQEAKKYYIPVKMQETMEEKIIHKTQIVHDYKKFH